MPANRPLAITCGGTGGHVYPAVAVAQELKSGFLFLGTRDRQDTKIIARYGFPYEAIPSSRRNVWVMLKAYFAAKKILRKHGVGCLLSMGGYSTLPVILAADLAAFVLRAGESLIVDIDLQFQI